MSAIGANSAIYWRKIRHLLAINSPFIGDNCASPIFGANWRVRPKVPPYPNLCYYKIQCDCRTLLTARRRKGWSSFRMNMTLTMISDYLIILIIALASAKVTTISPQPCVPECSNKFFFRFLPKVAFYEAHSEAPTAPIGLKFCVQCPIA
eukprot:sb/3473571/